MGQSIIDLTDDLRLRRVVDLWDDFHFYSDGTLWTKGTTGAGSPTVTNVDNVNGLMRIFGGTTANDEAWLATTRKNFLPQSAPTASPLPAGKTLVCEARINFQEANTNNACIYFGFCDSFATGLLTASTGVPKNSFSGMGIYLQQGDTTPVWRTIVSNGSTQSKHTANGQVAAPGLATDQTLRIEARVMSATVCEVVYFVDNQPVFDAAVTNANFRVKDQFTYTSLNKMGVGVYLLNVSTTAETVLVDYIGAWQLR